MPELPEVETVVRSIASKIIGNKIKSIHVFWDKTLATHSQNSINATLKNNKIKSVSRRGKYIILKLDSNYLVIHLRMTGKLIFLNPNQNSKLTHLRFNIIFKDNSTLNFTDIRKFGRIELRNNLDFLEKKLGPEPMSKNLSIEYLHQKLKSRTGSIKSSLLNQNVIAGLGNIYTDEILWEVNIHPEKPANELNIDLLGKLISASKKIIFNAIEAMGTTIINFSFDRGSKGQYGSRLKVFNRKGKTCYRCSEIIQKIRCASRGTYYCPKCQIL